MNSFFQRDANHVPITNKGVTVTKTVAFTGAAGLGAVGTVSLFTVTGDVVVNVVGVCTENLASAGGGTLEVGIAGNTAALIAQTTATAIDAGETWVDATPATVVSYPSDKVLVNGTDIIATVATGDITDGTITFYCNFTPLSSTGEVA